MNALWMRVVANIGQRKVTWRAVMSLGLPRAAAVGHLVMLWGGALESETNGYLNDIPDAQIEAWAGWDGEPGRFAQFVRAHHVDADGRINEWDDYAGVLEAQRERERTKKAAQRARNAPAKPARKPSPRTPRDNTGDVPGDVPGKSRDKERKGTVSKRDTTAANAAPRGDRRAPRQDDDPPGFADAWAAYPARSGGNPRNRAVRAYRARLADGVDPAALLDGVRRYADWCDATGKAGTELVQQAATFFGPSKAWDEPWAVPPQTGPRIVPQTSDPLSPPALRARLVEFGLTRFGGDRPAYARRVADACPPGMELAKWEGVVRVLKPWDLNEITFPPEVERTIAARLAAGGGVAA